MLLLARAAATIGVSAVSAGARVRSKARMSINHIHDTYTIANLPTTGKQKRTYFYKSSASTSNFVIPALKVLYDPREEAILLARYNNKSETNDVDKRESDSDAAAAGGAAGGAAAPVCTSSRCSAVFEDVCAKEYFKTLYMLHAWWGCTGEEECGCPSPEEWGGEYTRPVGGGGGGGGGVYRRGSEVAGWYVRRCQLKAIEEAGGCSTVHPGLHWDEEARRPTVSLQQTDKALHHPGMTIVGGALPTRQLRVPTNLLLFSVHSHTADYNALDWHIVPRTAASDDIRDTHNRTNSSDHTHPTTDNHEGHIITHPGYDRTTDGRGLYMNMPPFVPPPLRIKESYFLKKAEDHPTSLTTPPLLQLRRAQAYGLRPCLVLDLQAIAKGKLACFVPLSVYQDLWQEASRGGGSGHLELAGLQQAISACVVADRVLAEFLPLPARRSGFSFSCQAYGNCLELILKESN